MPGPVQTVTETNRVPTALTEACYDPYKKVSSTAQIVDQLLQTRVELQKCGCKVDGVAEWDARNAGQAYTPRRSPCPVQMQTGNVKPSG